MSIEDIHKKNAALLAKVLHKRRKIGNNPFEPISWKRYIRRLQKRFEDVKNEALRAKSLTPEEMFFNFLDLLDSTELMKLEVGKPDVYS